MFRKTLVVVGALAAGTVLSDGSALASWHHHGFHHHHHHERWSSYYHHRHFRFAAHRHFYTWHHHFAYGSRRLHALRSYASYRRAEAQQAYAGAYANPASAYTAPAYTTPTYTTPAVTAPVSSGGYVQTGSASYYGGGGRTAAGGHVGFATCAHRSLPFGTRVLVTNLANLRQTVLTVNDRGPFVHGRMLDVSRGAAGVLGMIGSGVARIRMEVVGRAG